MNFDALDRRMRAFEAAYEDCVLPGLSVVARLDGRSFTRLTKELLDFEAPFDLRFHAAMTATVQHLMNIGLRVVYGYTQSDEISLLLHRDEDFFGRRVRKLLTVLAGEASAKLSLQLGVPACLDCRLALLPNDALVVDYFRWRQADAQRNALNAHCYWALRQEGRDAHAANAALRGLSFAAKHDVLFARGVNFNDLPEWQRRGSGVRWVTLDVAGRDPRDGSATLTQRRDLVVDAQLPMKDAYGDYVRGILAAA